MSEHADAAPRIEPIENGPLRFRRGDREGRQAALCGPDRAPLTAGGSVLLCRCGASDRKPFCDGSHTDVAFTSARQWRGTGRVVDYVGERITVHDNRSLCAHVGYCYTELPQVFRQGERPWVDPDGATVEAVIAICEKCPSGALTYSIDGEEGTPPAREPAVIASAGGPYFVEGDVVVADDAITAGMVPGRCTLCRCGGSHNKPLCDGKHHDIGFTERAD